MIFSGMGGHIRELTTHCPAPPSDPNRRRNVAVAVAATAAVLLVALAALLGGPGRRRDGLLQADLDDIAHRATFCGAFDDPVQCLRDHISSRHRYWTAKEVREELWTTMKGLAELEVSPCPPLA